MIHILPLLKQVCPPPSDGSSRRSRRRKIAGVTLAELLVVIMIMGILFALIFPLTKVARASSMNATCVNNLKQMGGALLRFAADNQGRLLPSKLSDDVRNKKPTPRPSGYWDIRLHNEGYLPGPMEDGQELNSMLYCPALTPGGRPRQLHHNYGLRDWRGTLAKTGDYIRLQTIESPSRFFILADSIQSSGGHQWYAIQSEGGANGVHLRHSNRANAFFADGHVEPMTAEYFETLPATEPEFTRRPFKTFKADGTQL